MTILTTIFGYSSFLEGTLSDWGALFLFPKDKLTLARVWATRGHLADALYEGPRKGWQRAQKIVVAFSKSMLYNRGVKGKDYL